MKKRVLLLALVFIMVMSHVTVLADDYYTTEEAFKLAFGEDMQSQSQMEVVVLVAGALRNSGYNDAAICGVLGCFFGESKLNPLSLEHLVQQDRMSFADYEAAVSSAGWTKTVTLSSAPTDRNGNPLGPQGKGAGLGQWTAGRHTKFSDYCNKNGYIAEVTIQLPSSGSAVTYIGDVGTQVAYLLQEGTWNNNYSRFKATTLDQHVAELRSMGEEIPDSCSSLVEYMNFTTSPYMAAIAWACCWEVPGSVNVGNSGYSEETARGTFQKVGSRAQGVYDYLLGGKAGQDDRVKPGGYVDGYVLSQHALTQATDLASQLAGKYWTEDQLSAYCKLNEINIEDVYLQYAKRENLSQSELEGLTTWQMNIDVNRREEGLISLLRTLVAVVGVALTVWSMFMYFAYWFDSVFPFDVDLLGKITVSQLHICPYGDKPTFTVKDNKGRKTVSHRQMVFICCVAMLFGVMMITGWFYMLISRMVRLMLSFFK